MQTSLRSFVFAFIRLGKQSSRRSQTKKALSNFCPIAAWIVCETPEKLYRAMFR
jgi:hypothetical protein